MLAGLISVNLLFEGSPKGLAERRLSLSEEQTVHIGWCRRHLAEPTDVPGGGRSKRGEKETHTNRASPTAKDARGCTVSSKTPGCLTMELVGIKSGWIWGP